MPQVTKELSSAVGERGCSLHVMAHVGTNDASARRCEEILDLCEDLISEVTHVRGSSGASFELSLSSFILRID